RGGQSRGQNDENSWYGRDPDRYGQQGQQIERLGRGFPAQQSLHLVHIGGEQGIPVRPILHRTVWTVRGQRNRGRLAAVRVNHVGDRAGVGGAGLAHGRQIRRR